MKPTLRHLMRLCPVHGEEGRVAPGSLLALTAVLVAQVALGVAAQQSAASVAAAPTHSTTIALTSDEQRVIVVNREANSISIIRVRNNQGNDVANKIAEIGVGEEPRCVAVDPNDRFAYVTNAISGTVCVVNLRQRRVVRTINGATGLRTDAEWNVALCRQPHGRYCGDRRHGLADGCRKSQGWTQPHRHCDHE
jgi:hypothetical protein